MAIHIGTTDIGMLGCMAMYCRYVGRVAIHYWYVGRVAIRRDSPICPWPTPSLDVCIFQFA